MLESLDQLTKDVEIRAVLHGPNGARVLIRFVSDDSDRITKEVRGGALRSIGVTRAQNVDLAEWETDIELVRRMLQKDESALTAAIARFGGNTTTSLAGRFRGVLREADIQAVVNHAAWKLWKSVSRFDPELGTLAAWFYRIAEREAYDCIRGVPSNAERL